MRELPEAEPAELCADSCHVSPRPLAQYFWFKLSKRKTLEIWRHVLGTHVSIKIEQASIGQMRFRKILGLVFPLQMQHVARFLHLLLKVPPVLRAFCVFSLSLVFFVFRPVSHWPFPACWFLICFFLYPVRYRLPFFFSRCILQFFSAAYAYIRSFFLLLVIPRFVSLLLRVLFFLNLPGSGSSCFFLL